MLKPIFASSAQHTIHHNNVSIIFLEQDNAGYQVFGTVDRL